MSGSTSTSHTWVEKAEPTPRALTAAVAEIGPPVRPQPRTMPARGSGCCEPSFIWAWPSTHSTWSGSTDHCLAARAHRSAFTFRQASTTAVPVASVVRLPAVESLKPTVSVSATIDWIFE